MSVNTPSGLMITIVLTHYQRTENLLSIYAVLRKQSLKPTLYLWDNQPVETIQSLEWDIYVRSQNNLLCKPRWHLAKTACTPFVAIMDDDITCRDLQVLEDAVNYMKRHTDVAAIGVAGVVLEHNKSYQQCRHISVHRPSRSDTSVDVIKGRFMLCRSGYLSGFEPATQDCEDIEASAHLGEYGSLVISQALSGRFIDLPSGDYALHNREEHYSKREAARRRYFAR